MRGQGEVIDETAAHALVARSRIEHPQDEVQRQRIMQRTFGTVTRQVSLDPGDDMQM